MKWAKARYRTQVVATWFGLSKACLLILAALYLGIVEDIFIDAWDNAPGYYFFLSIGSLAVSYLANNASEDINEACGYQFHSPH